MNKTKLILLAVTIFGFALAASLAEADQITANIQFPFLAGGKELPAGNYLIVSELRGTLTLRNMTTGEGTFVPYLDRVSAKGVEKPHLIFDEDADHYYLSQVFMAGIDGFEVVGAPGRHTHVTVTEGKK